MTPTKAMVLKFLPCQWALPSVFGNFQVDVRIEWEMPEEQMEGLK